MKKLIALTVVAIILASGFFYSTARADTIADCQNLIDKTAGDLAGVAIGGNHPERTRDSLQSKLDGASTKLSEGKLLDAIAKLVDFNTAVNKMATAAKPKIGSEDAELLVNDANNVIACIQSLLDGG